MIKKFDDIIAEINKANRIAIFGHINTDGDAMGSCLGLKHFLENIGKNVDFFSDTLIPDNLTFLPEINQLNQKNFSNYDLSIAVDTFQDRLGKYEKDFFKSKSSILIDHHTGNTNFAKINHIVPKASSTCFLIYEMIKYWDIKFDNNIALPLITGILTDTGGLKFSNTDKATVSAYSELLEYISLPLYQLNNFIFENKPKTYFEIYKRAILATEFLLENKLVVITLREKDFKEVGIDYRNVKNLSKIGTELKDSCITIVISEGMKNDFHISFRSNGQYDVRKCAEVFGGGGHISASGCRIFGSYESVRERLIKSASDELGL